MVKTNKSNIASYILLGGEILIILYNYSSPESLIRIWWSEHTSLAFMAVRVVEFSNGVYKIRKIFA